MKLMKVMKSHKIANVSVGSVFAKVNQVARMETVSVHREGVTDITRPLDRHALNETMKRNRRNERNETKSPKLAKLITILTVNRF